MDDNDIARLYPIAHWQDMPDDLVESEYAALSFLSPRRLPPLHSGVYGLRAPPSGQRRSGRGLDDLEPRACLLRGRRDPGFRALEAVLARGRPARGRDRLPRGGLRGRRRLRRRPGREGARLLARPLGRAGLLLDRRAQTAGGLGCRALERPYVPLEERDCAYGRRGHDRRGATARCEDGDLADDVSGPHAADACAVYRDVGCAFLDQEQGVAEVTLGDQCLPGGELAL